MNIVEFLEAWIAEDERSAEAGGYHNGRGVFANDNYGCLLVQPARVLAECAAKRAIMKLAQDAAEVEKEFLEYVWAGAGPEQASPLAGDAIILALAAVYMDHPDYREDWSDAT